MHKLAPTIFLVLAPRATEAQRATASQPAERVVRGNTIISDRLPAADLTVGDDFRYVGGQVVNLYGNAEAEQHLFVQGATSGPVERFYWIQYEHFLPTNDRRYDYRPDRTTDIGGLKFIYDATAYPDYGVSTFDPRSDGAAVAALLAQHHLALPTRVVRVRMFYLPSADHRTELMIIYGEALQTKSVIPTDSARVPLDSAYPSAAQQILDHARQGLAIHPH
jgi:hypothetical protein